MGLGGNTCDMDVSWSVRRGCEVTTPAEGEAEDLQMLSLTKSAFFYKKIIHTAY
jgi:hypothetical protein